jgi:hypothetical protein
MKPYLSARSKVGISQHKIGELCEWSEMALKFGCGWNFLIRANQGPERKRIELWHEYTNLEFWR